MRQILFRGRRLDNGEWIYGDLQLGDGDHIPMIGVVRGGHDPYYYQVEEATVWQFTGLRDKDSRPIYEGDIVRYIDCNDTISINEVLYADAGFTPVCEIAWMADIEGTECEVIGNRFDNPDLLNGK